MAGTRAWLAWVVCMTILCHSSQIMLTEYPPAPASNTVPLPVLSAPTHRPWTCVQGPEASAGKQRRRCRDSLTHQRGGTALAKYEHYRPRRAAADSDAHLGQAPSSSTVTPCWRRISRRWMPTYTHGSNRCSVIHSSPSASFRRAATGRRGSTTLRSAWMSCATCVARTPRPACAVHGSATMPSTREYGRSVGVGGGLARASYATHRCVHTCVHLGCGRGCERVGVQGFKSER